MKDPFLPNEDANRRDAAQRHHEAFVREVTGQGSVPEFRLELEALINKHSQERHSDTPDFMLASFLCRVLETFGEAVKDRDRWYGRGPGAAAVDAVFAAEPPPQPDCIEKHQGDYKQEAWRNYTFEELGNAVAFFTKRASHRSSAKKRDKDLYDAGNYLDMLTQKFANAKAELAR